jgi:ElaB/YqjD/DUF883 family membrane-anchored ribosome-binding protein
MVESDPRGPIPQRDEELAHARLRARAAWSRVEADLARLREAVGAEVDQVKRLGPRSFFLSHPLPVVAAAAGAGFLLGMRGGRRRVAYRAIVHGVPELLASGPTAAAPGARPEKSLRRKLLETLVLAIASRGAQALAEHAEARINRRDRRASGTPTRIPEGVRGSL